MSDPFPGEEEDAGGPAGTLPDIREFADNLTSLNAAEVLLGNSPLKENVQPINPATWMRDFDRNTARPSTSRWMERCWCSCRASHHTRVPTAAELPLSRHESSPPGESVEFHTQRASHWSADAK